MSEELTPDPVLDKLTRFTPIAVNREQLLFEAGRASVRRSSGWKWISVGLLVGHALWLMVWLWPSPPEEAANPVPVNVSPPSAASLASPSELNESESISEPLPANSYLAIRQQLTDGGIDEFAPLPNPDALPSGMPLRASSRLFLLD